MTQRPHWQGELRLGGIRGVQQQQGRKNRHVMFGLYFIDKVESKHPHEIKTEIQID